MSVPSPSVMHLILYAQLFVDVCVSYGCFVVNHDLSTCNLVLSEFLEKLEKIDDRKKVA